MRPIDPKPTLHSVRATVLCAIALLTTPAWAGAAPHAHHHHQTTPTAAAPADVPPLTILLPKNGATVGQQLAVVFETPGEIAKLTMDAPVVGLHLHIDSNEVSMMPMSRQLIRLGHNRYLFLFDLPAKPGEQTVKVYWSDAMHRTIESTVRSVTVRVEADGSAQN